LEVFLHKLARLLITRRIYRGKVVSINVSEQSGIGNLDDLQNKSHVLSWVLGPRSNANGEMLLGKTRQGHLVIRLLVHSSAQSFESFNTGSTP